MRKSSNLMLLKEQRDMKQQMLLDLTENQFKGVNTLQIGVLVIAGDVVVSVDVGIKAVEVGDISEDLGDPQKQQRKSEVIKKMITRDQRLMKSLDQVDTIEEGEDAVVVGTEVEVVTDVDHAVKVQVTSTHHKTKVVIGLRVILMKRPEEMIVEEMVMDESQGDSEEDQGVLHHRALAMKETEKIVETERIVVMKTTTMVMIVSMVIMINLVAVVVVVDAHVVSAQETKGRKNKKAAKEEEVKEVKVKVVMKIV